MDDKAIIIFGLLGLGLLFFFTRGRSYNNEETWAIDWGEDGLPLSVTIHRDAVQK